MPRKCRDYFTAAEIARAFDVPADKIETAAGKKVYLNQIGDIREAVLSVYSKWIGNGFTVDECNRLMGLKLTILIRCECLKESRLRLILTLGKALYHLMMWSMVIIFINTSTITVIGTKKAPLIKLMISDVFK